MMKLFSSQRFLAIYSGVLTLIFAVTVFAAVSEPSHRQKFGELDVERINVVEPDGTSAHGHLEQSRLSRHHH